MSKRVSNKKGKNQGARKKVRLGWRKRLLRDQMIIIRDKIRLRQAGVVSE